jgi:hypothetical protein
MAQCPIIAMKARHKHCAKLYLPLVLAMDNAGRPKYFKTSSLIQCNLPQSKTLMGRVIIGRVGKNTVLARLTGSVYTEYTRISRIYGLQ